MSRMLRNGVKGASNSLEDLANMIKEIPILKFIFGTPKKTRKSRTKEK